MGNIDMNQFKEISLFGEDVKEEPGPITKILSKNRRLSKMVEATLVDIDIEKKRRNPENDKMKEIQNEKVYITEKSLRIRNKRQKELLEEMENSQVKKKERKIFHENHIDLPKISKASKELTSRALTKLIYIIILTDTVITLLGSNTFKEISSGYDQDASYFGLMSQTGLHNMEEVARLFEERFKEIGVNIIEINHINLDTEKSLYGFYNFSDNVQQEELRKGQIYISKWVGKFNVTEDNLFEYNRGIKSREKKTWTINCQVIIKVYEKHIFTKGSEVSIGTPMRMIATVLNNLMDDPLDPNTNKLYLHPEYLDKDVFKRITIFENASPNNEKNLEAKNNQIETMSLLLMKIFMWLSRAYGQRLVSYICKELVIHERNLLTAKAKKVSAYFAIFDLNDILEHIDDRYSMVYMNEVADMIYRISDRYKAHALMLKSNQYFIVWKLDNPNATDNFNKKNINRNSKEIASVSFTTIMKILSKLNTLKKDFEFLGDKDFDDFVHLSLHCGTFYESIVGSYIKADITYMGLDISLAHKTHDNLKKFKTAFCLTERVFTILPECMKVHCRQIDQVKILVSDKPFGLYAVDVTNKFADISDYEFLNKAENHKFKISEEEEAESFKSITTFSKHGYEYREKVKKNKKTNSIFPASASTNKNTKNSSAFSPPVRLTNKFNFSSIISKIQRGNLNKSSLSKISQVSKRKIHVEMKAIIIKRLSKGAKNSLFLADLEIQKLFMLENEFKRNYRKGFDFYRLGAWSAAKEFFENAIKAKLEDEYDEDGPCLYLLKYMEGFNFVKRFDWRGWRWLDDAV